MFGMKANCVKCLLGMFTFVSLCVHCRYRGGGGPLHVSRGKTSHPLHKAFIEAGQQAGYPFTDDMNGHQQEGLGWMDMTIYNGLNSSNYIYRIIFNITNQPLLIICMPLLRLCREEVEHGQRLPEACPGSTQPEDRGALPHLQDPVWWKPCRGSWIHTEGTEEEGKMLPDMHLALDINRIWWMGCMWERKCLFLPDPLVKCPENVRVRTQQENVR